jgi:hypothetical protein
MHRDFDRNLDAAVDLTATPPLRRGVAAALALLLAALIACLFVDAKGKQDAATAAKKAQKHKAVAETEK